MQRKSAIGHTDLPFNCPHSQELANELVSLLQLSEQSHVLDLGCGKAELLTQILERYGCKGTGVDTNSNILSLARQPCWGTMQLLEKDMTAFIDENNAAYEGIMCIGSIRAGQQEATIAQLASFLSRRDDTKRSFLLIGELVWVDGKSPSTEFLDHLGMTESDYCTLDRLIAICQDNGLEVVFSTKQSLEYYETRILANIEEWAARPANVSDPDYDVIVGRSREWHKFSKQHAWNTWEFATILAKVAC